MKKLEFPKEFLWGASTSDFQIEGAARQYGKGETIWDRYCKEPGRILNDDNADTSCDHYHRYAEDVEIMKEIGLKAYRMSISWARIFPEGYGAPNRQGLDFYKRLIEQLLKNNIKPVVTLHHWGFPQKLQDIGGWANRSISDYYADYASFIFKELGDLVDMWITHNEPIGTSYLGFFKGCVAPGIQDFYTSVLVTHHLLLSHAKAVEAFRQSTKKGEIGITLNFHPAIAMSDKPEDIEAEQRIGLYFDRWFSDALFNGKFPRLLLDYYDRKGIEIPRINDEDMKRICTPLDFLGVNYYYPHHVRYNPLKWPFEADFEPCSKGSRHTKTGWDIYPEGLYRTIKKLKDEYGNKKIYITENGAAFNDYPDRNSNIQDMQRIDFHDSHIRQVYRCIQEGMNIRGYFIWSLMDNFEWTYGFTQRFGLTYIDYLTQKRTLKSSAHWYRDIIQKNGLD